MAVRVAINGYGRIGRMVLRAIYEYNRQQEIIIVAINSSHPIATNVHLTKFDTTHGRFTHAEVTGDDEFMYVNGDPIKMLSDRNPENLPWGDIGVDVVLECTGKFKDRKGATMHLNGGAKKVLISAPGGDDIDATVVYGVNDEVLSADDKIVSCASCTTNCLAPLAKALHQGIGIEKGLMTTIHSYTNDQKLIDNQHADLLRARAAAQSIIPTKSGAAKAVGLVLPELKGKLNGFALRVPTINVSVVDLVFDASRDTSSEEVNEIVKAASDGHIMVYNEDPLVSVDFNHHPASSIFDATQTRVYGDLVKVLAWYDNEWGFSCRMIDLAIKMAKLLKISYQEIEINMTIIKMSDLDLSNKRVLIREDFNVPISNGKVSSDARLIAALPSIKLALSKQAKVMLMSHLGRPTEGNLKADESLQPIVDYLNLALDVPVRLETDYLDGVDINTNEVIVFENVRGNVGEKSNDSGLSQKLAALCDVFVNDAFGTAHRAQASTYGVAQYANTACAGPLLVAEIDALTKALDNPAKPFIAIVGGSKVSTKLTVLETLSEKVDQLIVGGGIANTFSAANNLPIGKSLVEIDLIPKAKSIMAKAKANGADIPIPSDVVVAKEFSPEAAAITKNASDVATDDMILDIGPNSANQLATMLKTAATIIWNGPVGVFEFDQFGEGTKTLAMAIAESDAFSIAGGGDTLAAVDKYQIKDKISYISTGGGAFLEFVEGKPLPAVEILKQRAQN